MILTFLLYCICLSLAYLLELSFCYKNKQAQTLRHTKQIFLLLILILPHKQQTWWICEYVQVFTMWPVTSLVCKLEQQPPWREVYPSVMPNPHLKVFFLWLRKAQRASDRGRGCNFFSRVAPTTQLLSNEPREKETDLENINVTWFVKSIFNLLVIDVILITS